MIYVCKDKAFAEIRKMFYGKNAEIRKMFYGKNAEIHKMFYGKNAEIRKMFAYIRREKEVEE